MSKLYTVFSYFDNKTNIVLQTNDLQEALEYVGDNENKTYSIKKRTNYCNIYETIM